MTQRLSTPKEKLKFVLLEGIHPSALDTLRDDGYTTIETSPKALAGAALTALIADAHFVGIRSRTHLTAEVLAQAPKLVAIGCFCIGTNQVDLGDAMRRGIPVFNAPFSNTRSVAELVLAEIVMLLRGIPHKNAVLHRNGWVKSAARSFEARGKTLGIVGYGHIGTQIGVLAEQLGMTVVFHDIEAKLPLGNARPLGSLGTLLEVADVVSLHVPETPATQGMIGEAEIARMKPGACLINNSRGTVLDLEALAAALRAKQLAGAAVDVFPVEPSSNTEKFASPLQGLDNVILTPHVGGSTEEAQERIGSEVARKLVEYSDVGSTTGAVNFPQVQLSPRTAGTRFIQVQRNLPGELTRLNDVFARHKVNIAAQHYETAGDLGYVVLDADGPVAAAEAIVREIRALPGTIRARMLYRKA